MLNSTATFYFHSLVTLANLPPLGLENAGAEGMRSEENIYTIEENIYEMEDPYEYYCSVNSEQQSWQRLGCHLSMPSDPTTSFLSLVFFENCEMCQLTGFRGSVHGHQAEFFHFLKIISSLGDWTVTCTLLMPITSVFQPMALPNSESANQGIRDLMGFYTKEEFLIWELWNSGKFLLIMCPWSSRKYRENYVLRYMCMSFLAQKV